MHILLLFIAGALAGPPDVAPEVWTERDDGPPLCLSAMPDEGKLRRKDRAAFVAARQALADGGELPAGALEGLREHPAIDALRAVAAVIEGSEAEPLLELAEEHPGDPCLGTTAATAAWFGEGDADRAQALATAAWIRQRDPRLAYILGTLLAEKGAYDRMERVVERGLLHDPDHAGLKGLLAADPQTLDDAWEAGRLDDYLSLAAARGAPLGPASDLPPGELDLTGLREALGLEDPDDELVATLYTSRGPISCTLFVDRAPVTVASFVGLATGEQAWTDPRTDAPGEGAMYRDVPIHRVIPGFMIQTGDPTGTGRGGPGYRFHDEIDPDLRFDRPGRLAMANTGPDSNGSQFFVTDAPTPHLDGKHTIFGQCDAPTVVSAIASVPTGADAKPKRDVLLERVEIDVR